MKCIFTFILIILASTSFAAGYSFTIIEDKVNLPVPDGWVLYPDNSTLPVQLIHDEPTAEILIFESDIDKSDIITNAEQFKSSIDLVIDDVFKSLPDAKIITSTGKSEEYRALFIVDFESLDSMTAIEIHHRFAGYVYRHPDGHQLLFTIWGKSGKENFQSLEADIDFVINQFEFLGEYEDQVFKTERNSIWLILFAMMLSIWLMGSVRRRKRKEALLARESNQAERSSSSIKTP